MSGQFNLIVNPRNVSPHFADSNASSSGSGSYSGGGSHTTVEADRTPPYMPRNPANAYASRMDKSMVSQTQDSHGTFHSKKKRTL